MYIDHPESHRTKNEGAGILCNYMYLLCNMLGQFSAASKFSVFQPGSQSSAKACQLSPGNIEVLAFATLFFRTVLWTAGFFEE